MAEKKDCTFISIGGREGLQSENQTPINKKPRKIAPFTSNDNRESRQGEEEST